MSSDNTEYEQPDDHAEHEPGYDRPERGDEADPCAHTSYEAGDDAGYPEKASADGEVPATGEGATGLERRVWDALYGVEDPEMPVSVVDLGLVYGVSVDADAGSATIDMTLTYTGCPARDMLLGEVERAVADVDGIAGGDGDDGVTGSDGDDEVTRGDRDDGDAVTVRLVWSPGWTVDMVTPEGREALREFGLSV